MSCIEVAKDMIKMIEEKKYPFIMCNFAPTDMVRNTGKYESAILGVETTDKAIGMLLEACKNNDFTLLVTADRGNSEKMISEKGGPHSAHTTNRVLFCMTGSKKFKEPKHNADLCDLAPTILALMGLDQPSEMTGQSLFA